MKAMALAAGKGTRLFPLTGEIPKPMAPVVDTPIIEHIFDLLAGHGVRGGPRQRPLPRRRPALGLRRGVPEKRHEPCTWAGRTSFWARPGASSVWLTSFDDTFVVVSGDALTDVNIEELVAFHREKGALATIALRWVYDTSEFGVVEVDDEGNIQGFQEKPSPEEAISTLANTGIYVFEPRALDYVPEDTFFDFAQDVFPKFLEEGERFVGYKGDFYWSDIGTLEAYRQAQYDVLSGKVGVRIPGEKRGEGLWVGEDAQIHRSASIEGHVLVGRDAVVGRGVKLSGRRDGRAETAGSARTPPSSAASCYQAPASGTARTLRTASWATTTTCARVRPSGGEP